MILALLTASALAAAPTGGVAALGQASGVGRPAWEAAGLSLTGGLALQERLDLELGLDLGLAGAGGAFASGRVGWRFRAAPAPGPAWSTTLAYGAAWAAGVRPSGLAAVAIDLGADEGRAWRVQGGAVSDGLRLAGAQLTVGRAWGRRPATPAPEPPAEPVVSDAAAPPAVAPPIVSATISPEGAAVWLPHPWCRWMPVHDGAVQGPPDLAGAQARVTAPAHRPADLVLAPGATVALDPAPDQGSLVLAAHPGDRVLRGEVELAIGADGVAVLRAPSGRVELVVEGGGRRQPLVAAVSDGHVTWARVAAPAEARVGFSVGSARLDDAGAAALDALARQAGAWGFRVQGGASPEGLSDKNAALASRRADVCAAALVSAGLPDARVVVERTPLLPSDGEVEVPERWRTCILTPLPPGGAP